MPRVTTPSAIVETDPTQTVVLRERFIKQINGRWQTLRGDIRDTIDHNDALRLSDGEVDPGEVTYSPGSGTQARTWPFDEPTEMYRPADFAPEDDADRLEKLRGWLKYILAERVVSPTSEDERKAGNHYTGDPIRQAFLKGFKRAGAELRKQRYDTTDRDVLDVLQDRTYRRHLRQLWVDTYTDLVGASQDTLRAISETASSILRQTVSRRFFANEVIREVREVGESHTFALAHARAIEAANRAAVTRYAESGVDRVGLMVEEPEEDLPPFTYPWIAPEAHKAGERIPKDERPAFEDTTHPIDVLQDGTVELPPYWEGSRAFVRPL